MPQLAEAPFSGWHAATFRLGQQVVAASGQNLNQGPNFYIKSGMGSTLHSAPVTLVDASMFGLLALNQYTANFPLLSSDAVLASVKMLARQSFENKTYKIPKEPQKSGYHHQGA
uniref:Uncharacterized protein n=1 Tax=Citrobacter freundii TaxID=546 RepID=A0A2I7QF82_CITFR|nr:MULTISPECIES: hypothetical protein [Enterobacteriaceae]AUR79977.1 hypothetical protein pCf587_0198 [Citrobacter freundii]UHP21192.1 hypothetical protein pKpnLUIS_00189 [Klebsiella pneumoniae]